MQNDFIDGTLGTSEAQAIVSQVCRKIKNFDGDVIYTQDTHGKNYLYTFEGRKLPVIHCIKDTEGWQINSEVFAEGKCKCIAIIEKQTFGSEKLAQIVEDNGYERVTLIGLCTDICIINNAMIIKAKCHEIPVVVDSTCCAGITPESHQRALDAMGMCQIEII